MNNSFVSSLVFCLIDGEFGFFNFVFDGFDPGFVGFRRDYCRHFVSEHRLDTKYADRQNEKYQKQLADSIQTALFGHDLAQHFAKKQH